jgi:FkbM family methyltransferase
MSTPDVDEFDPSALAGAIAKLARGEDRDDNPHVRRRRIVDLMNEGRLNDAEAALRPLLDVQWKVPENIYLFGILALLRGQITLARRAIDRALALKPWLVEVPSWCGSLRDRLDEAADLEPAWDYPRYRRRLDAFDTFGLTLTSALSTHFEHPDVQLVQVGANDGVHTDPMHGWIVKFGWRSLLIEPMPEPFAALEELHRDHPNVTLANVAIADQNGTRTMWSHPSGRHAVSTFRPERNILKQEAELVGVEVECMTLSSLLDRHAIQRIDVLQVDTEGYDLDVLRLVDFERFHPSVIHLEFYLLPVTERLELFDLLEGQAYAWRAIGADLLAVDVTTFEEQFGLVTRPSRERVDARDVPGSRPGPLEPERG